MPLRGKGNRGNQPRLRGSPIFIPSQIQTEGAGEQGRLKIEDATLFAFRAKSFVNCEPPAPLAVVFFCRGAPFCATRIDQHPHCVTSQKPNPITRPRIPPCLTNEASFHALIF